MANTKGTSAISIPQGGGALSGIGEKFSPDLFSGTGNYGVPIAVPPGRNGFQPDLNLGYSSGNGNGPFGLGWTLGSVGVSRKTSKGIPIYDDTTDIFILSGGEDLVPVKIENDTVGGIPWERTFYRPRTEGLFARIIRHRKGNGEHYWEVRDKDGSINWYGTAGAAQNDPCVVANPENRASIFSWVLSKTEDPLGNVVVYEYDRELVTAGDRVYDQLYVSKIKYVQYPFGGELRYLCEIRFFYEDRPDPFSSYRQGFEIRTTKRCVRIETHTLADVPTKAKTYHFDYSNDSPGGMSLLTAVRVEGHDGTESEFMPPLELGYSVFDPQKRDLVPVKGQLPSASLAEPGFELVDLDGNGLPDILQLNGVARRWPNLGNGKFGPPLELDIAPTIQLGMPGVQLVDADGDGKSDLLVNNGITAGYFPGRFRTVWDTKSFRPYPQVPSFRFDDPEVSLLDLDGDGITDVLRNGSRFECFFNDPEKGFYKTRFTDKTFADFSFADPRIRFADMTGDGLQDIVFISSGNVQYWPNMGYGRFGKPVRMRNAPRFPIEYNPRQVLLGDLDGDGLADMAYVEDNQVTLFVNQSGNSFSDGSPVKGTPRIQDPNALRVVDLLGTGQSGILWSYGAGENIAGQMFFLDFTAGNKPYLLDKINNNMGSLTRIAYGSSVYHYLRDEARPETRWQTDLPFPVLVVNQVEVLDLLSGGKLVTQYLYHHGYWDGAEREFRGFARVDVRDTESFERYNTQDLFSENETSGVTVEHYTPPTETRNWFYQGPVGDGYGKWFEPDFSHEYWSGAPTILERSIEMVQLLNSLPRRARRDALRTLRGSTLRTELYALDNSPLQDRPYTVTESATELRLEFDPSLLPDPLWGESRNGYSSGGGYIFFPFGTGQRTSQYERGDDPMHSFSFTKGYDAYGQPSGTLSVGIPRGADPSFGGAGTYLASLDLSEYIYADVPAGLYMTRVKRVLSYDGTTSAVGISVAALRDMLFENYAALPLVGAILHYYDGPAFEGRPYGEIENFGALVRTESLVLTQDVVDAAYGGTPLLLETSPAWTSDYPAEFQSLYPTTGGYLYKTFDPNVYPVTGWYVESSRTKYDFQVSGSFPVGLIMETQDTLGHTALVAYDDYLLMPVLTTDFLGLETVAEYDYRVMQVRRLRDPNLNITEFDFSPLGMLRAMAVIGKGTEGDFKSASGTFYQRFEPSYTMQYDLLAFMGGNPVWSQTTRRERHYTDPDDTGAVIISRQYSDGFGRLLQSRAQAEGIVFGNQTFGSSGLSASHSTPSAPAQGKIRQSGEPLNVIVSGWNIYNNKGAVVEQYEPFFDEGFDYVLPPNLGVRVRTYYDARGQAVRIVNPDDTEQRMIFGVPLSLSTPDTFTPTPWETYTYDPNDLAPLTHPSDTTVPTSHWFTPQSTVVDALGRTVRTTDHIDPTPPFAGNIVMRYEYDIRGNLLEVKDPEGRSVFRYQYGLGQSSQPIYTRHLDSGVSRVFFDALGRTVEGTDAKDARSLSIYDATGRPVYGWTKNNAGDTPRLTSYVVYGEDAPDPEDFNLLGQPWQQYDESGKLETIELDFKGNLISKKRYVIAGATLKGSLDTYETYLVDWTGIPSILDSNAFRSDSQFDALDRQVRITLPEDVDGNRKELVPSYNKGGALEKVSYDGTEYVRHIAYNAKGQRLLIAFGNDVMTRYAYDNRNFRLIRQRSEKYTVVQGTDTVTYSSDISGGNPTRQDDGFNFDLVGNILKILHRDIDCGIGMAPDALDRAFAYDPLYRLSSATGRESSTQNQNDYLYADAPQAGSPNASNVRAYTRLYTYDRVGNITRMQQTGTNAFTRNFVYNPGVNTVERINTGGASLIEDFTYDAVGNQITAGSTRNYVWNAVNRLMAYYNQAGSADPTIYAQYSYDDGGNRISKIVRTGTAVNPIYERTVYIDGVFEYVILEASSTYEKNYVHVVDDASRIATVRIGTPFPDDIGDAIVYNLENQIGSSAFRLDADGGLIDKEEYYPFGDSSLRTFEKKRYRYVGKEKDWESGLYYYGARYYSPWTCRFISVDPLASSYAQLSPYNYASNSPIGGIDVDGMQAEGEAPSQQSKDGAPTLPVTFELHKVTISATRPSILSSFASGAWGRVEDAWNIAMKYGIGSPFKSFREGKIGEGFLNLTGTYNAHRFFTDNWEGLLMMPVDILSLQWRNAYYASQGNWNRVAYESGGLTFDAALAWFGARVPTMKMPKIPTTVPKSGPALPIYEPNFALKPQYTNGSTTFTLVVKPKSGGRLGTITTRAQLTEIVAELESRGYTITGGGGVAAEEYLKPVGGGRKGGSYLDITADHPRYGTLRINTVDIYKSGLATKRELTNAIRIRTQIKTGEHLLLIKKKI